MYKPEEAGPQSHCATRARCGHHHPGLSTSTGSSLRGRAPFRGHLDHLRGTPAPKMSERCCPHQLKHSCPYLTSGLTIAGNPKRIPGFYSSPTPFQRSWKWKGGSPNGTWSSKTLLPAFMMGGRVVACKKGPKEHSLIGGSPGFPCLTSGSHVTCVRHPGFERRSSLACCGPWQAI